jgi:hypothetical protein
MKVQIERVSNDPTNDTLHVYNNDTRPLMAIWEDDLLGIMTEAQVKQWENGKHEFNLNSFELYRISYKCF